MLDKIREDIKRITEGEFSISVRLIAPDGEEATLQAIHSKIHHKIDANTLMSVNSQKASISFSEASLVEANPDYPIRPAGEVNLKNHQVFATDSTGTEKHYMVEEWFPDEMVGTISVILHKYEPDGD